MSLLAPWKRVTAVLSLSKTFKHLLECGHEVTRTRPQMKVRCKECHESDTVPPTKETR